LQPDLKIQGLVYCCKDPGSALPSSGASAGKHQGAGDDDTGRRAELKARGLVFEEYDYPNLKTVNSIAQVGPGRAAWFKDSEGNLLGLIQMG
jgi:hypothetical protein